MIVSKTYKENYISYLIFEIFMVAITTGIMIATIVFYIAAGSLGRRGRGNPWLIEFLFDNGWFYQLVCIIPALISLIFVFFYRRRNYVVGFKDDDEHIYLQVRGLSTKSFEQLTINRTDAKITKFEDPAFLIVPRYKGYRIIELSSGRKFEFVSNNFIWEKQIKDNVHICQLLGAMVK